MYEIVIIIGKVDDSMSIPNNHIDVDNTATTSAYLPFNPDKAIKSKSTFSVNLTNLYKNSSIQITTIAVHVGVSTKTIERWMMGSCEPTLTQFKKICELFNISADKLLW